MSFDLLLFSSHGNTISKRDFSEWFRNNPNYEVQDDQAFFENEQTGVHFIFEFSQYEYFENQPAPDLILLLNYTRPTPFSLEAAKEIDKIVAHFNLDIVDPQGDSPIRSKWNSEQFYSSYVDHSKRVIPALFEEEDLSHEVGKFRLESSVLHDIWHWNQNISAREEWLKSIDRELFIPSQLIFKSGDRIYDAAIWSDAIPSLIPKTSHILLNRSELGVRRFPLFKRHTTCELLQFTEFADLFSDYYEAVPEIPGAIWPPTDDRIEALELAVSKRPVGLNSVNNVASVDENNKLPEELRLTVIPFSDVLDIELFD